ncbi:MAG: class I SAM-dependent methyltransferase [Minisyncoccota bacterium]
MNSSPQVGKSHYHFGSYAFEGRFVSYYWQLKEVLAQEPSSVLEVGAGDGVLGNFIKNNTAVSYTSVDIAEDVRPDVVGSVLALPFVDASFDVVCAFEVLEHLPFEQFERALRELERVSKGSVIISLPHFGPSIKLSFKIPFLPEVHFAFKIPYPRRHVFNGQHYWEIGKRGYPVSRVRNILEKYFLIEKEFVPFGNQYHHFFILGKKDSSV